jgi:hypothetical protein
MFCAISVKRAAKSSNSCALSSFEAVMNQPSPLLQIRIHGTDGSHSSFTQSDAASVQRILNELQRPDLFTRERIIIAGHSSLTCLVTSKIARIDLVGEGLGRWNPKSPADAPEFIEISEHEFLAEREVRDLEPAGRSGRRLVTGECFAGVLDVQLSGGQHIYMKLHGIAALPAERLQKIHHLLMLPGLWFRLPGAGISLVHLSAATKFIACPGPAEVPGEAWLANE